MVKKFCNHFEEILSSVILAVMVSIAFVNVVTRYFIVYPLAFTEEVTVSMFVWIVLLGTSAAFRKKVHLSMTFVYDFLPLSLKKLCFVISNVMCVFFFGLLTWLGSIQVLEEYELNVTSEALAIPTAFYSAGIPVFSALVILRILQSCYGAVQSGDYQ